MKKYTVKVGKGEWKEVTRTQFAKAERDAGFHAEPGSGPLATTGFISSSTQISGRVEEFGSAHYSKLEKQFRSAAEKHGGLRQLIRKGVLKVVDIGRLEVDPDMFCPFYLEIYKGKNSRGRAHEIPKKVTLQVRKKWRCVVPTTILSENY